MRKRDVVILNSLGTHHRIIGPDLFALTRHFELEMRRIPWRGRRSLAAMNTVAAPGRTESRHGYRDDREQVSHVSPIY